MSKSRPTIQNSISVPQLSKEEMEKLEFIKEESKDNFFIAELRNYLDVHRKRYIEKSNIIDLQKIVAAQATINIATNKNFPLKEKITILQDIIENPRKTKRGIYNPKHINKLKTLFRIRPTVHKLTRKLLNEMSKLEKIGISEYKKEKTKQKKKDDIVFVPSDILKLKVLQTIRNNYKKYYANTNVNANAKSYLDQHNLTDSKKQNLYCAQTLGQVDNLIDNLFSQTSLSTQPKTLTTQEAGHQAIVFLEKFLQVYRDGDPGFHIKVYQETINDEAYKHLENISQMIAIKEAGGRPKEEIIAREKEMDETYNIKLKETLKESGMKDSDLFYPNQHRLNLEDTPYKPALSNTSEFKKAVIEPVEGLLTQLKTLFPRNRLVEEASVTAVFTAPVISNDNIRASAEHVENINDELPPLDFGNDGNPNPYVDETGFDEMIDKAIGVASDTFNTNMSKNNGEAKTNEDLKYLSDQLAHTDLNDLLEKEFKSSNDDVIDPKRQSSTAKIMQETSNQGQVNSRQSLESNKAKNSRAAIPAASHVSKNNLYNQTNTQATESQTKSDINADSKNNFNFTRKLR